VSLERIPDKVIYEAPGNKPGISMPVIVVLIGEDGDLWQLDTYDASDINGASLHAIQTSGKRIVEALEEYSTRGDD